ncbi:MAG: hypothetical protein H6841_03895 [Planctomycetes bacterium]|nr:hypothetical protein [Planctomycetota bacterium]
MGKFVWCATLILLGLLVHMPVQHAKPKKAKPPTPEEWTEAFFAAAHLRPEEHDKVSPGDLSGKGETGPAASFGIRRLTGRSMLTWPIFCAADTNGDMDLTRKELIAFFKLEEKGKAPVPSAADYAYEARVDGVKAFMDGLKNDQDKDGRLSMSELGLGADAEESFNTADLNGDESLDIHEFPGWYAVGVPSPEGDPLRLYRYVGSSWTYDFGVPGAGGALAEEWEVIQVTPNSALVQVTTLEEGKPSERFPVLYLRLWFSAGRKAWCLPPSGWTTKAEKESLDLPIGKVEATVFEVTQYRETTTEYYSDSYPGIPVKFMRGGYGFDGKMYGTLSSISIKEPKSKPKKGEPANEDAADNAAKLAGVNIFLMMDKDKDGRITAREYLDANKAYRDDQCKGKEAGARAHMEPWISPHHFVFADKDGTEGLSREEFDEYRKRFERRGSYPSPSSISRAELDRLCSVLAEDELDRYDADRDGSLTESDEIAGESGSAYRRFHKADLDADGSITRGELEEHHRARVLARAPDLAAAKESDSGKHDWKLDDKDLNFALFQKVGRRWTIKLTFQDGKQEASGRFENRVLRCDEEGAVVLTRFYGPSGKLVVSAKLAIAFTPEFEALLQPAPNAEKKGEETVKVAGRKWICDVYTMKLEGGVEGEEWMSRDMPGLRLKSSAMKGGRKIAFELTEFKD